MKKKPTTTIQSNTATDTTLEKEADVLFQRIFNKWYAFSADGENCYMTEVTDDAVAERLSKSTKNAA